MTVKHLRTITLTVVLALVVGLLAFPIAAADTDKEINIDDFTIQSFMERVIEAQNNITVSNNVSEQTGIFEVLMDEASAFLATMLSESSIVDELKNDLQASAGYSMDAPLAPTDVFDMNLDLLKDALSR